MLPFILFLVFAFVWSQAMPLIDPPFVLPRWPERRSHRSMVWAT